MPAFFPTLIAARAAVAAFAAMGILWGGYAAILPDLKTQLGVDEAHLGFLMLFTPLAAVAAMLIAPGFGQRFGRAALPLGVLVMVLAFQLPGHITLPLLFPLAMMCCGFGTGLTDVLMNARTAEMETARGQPLMNLTHAAYSFGYAGGAIGTGILRGQGWGPAAVLAVVSFSALVLVALTIEKSGRIQSLGRPKGGAGRLGPVPLIGGLLVLIAFLTENAAEGWSALHIEKTLGGSPEEGALGPATIALTMGIARLFGQGISARINAMTLLKGGAVVAAIGALIASQAGSPAMAYAGFIIMGIGASVIAPTAFSLVGQSAPDEARARYVARATLLGYLGYFVGPPALGLIAGAFGLRAAFVFAAIMLSLVFVLAPMLRRVSAQR